jgi:hypothetical protein
VLVRKKMTDVSSFTDEDILILRNAFIDNRTRILDCKGSFHREGRLREFHQEPIPKALYKPPLEPRQDIFIYRFNEFTPSLYGAGLVLFHQSHGLDHVHEEQCAHHPFRILECE